MEEDRIVVEKTEGESPLGKPKLRSQDNIKLYIKEIEWEGRSGLMWLRLAASDGLLCGRQRTFEFHKMLRISN